MLNTINEKLVQMQVAVIAMVSGLKNQRGQGSAEYLGVIIVAATLVIALVAIAGNWADPIGTAVEQAIEKIAQSIGG